LQGIAIVKAFSRLKQSEEEFHSVSREYLDAGVREIKVTVLFRPMIDLVAILAVVSVLVMSGTVTRAGGTEIGVIVAFIRYTEKLFFPIKDLAENGVGAIEYKSGRIDNIEVAVRRAIVTGANQTAIKTQETLADELGVDLVETTAHGGARPEHAKWQGKCYSRNGRKVIDGVVYEDLAKATRYGKADGLCGVNCRHSFRPYVHGTARTWNEKQLAKLDEKNIEYNGEKYTEYEASQIQRGLERNIRKQKRTVAALEAAGQDASAERKNLREAQKAYTDFTKQTGIRKQQARTQIG
jgi:ABC-type multidrug transport system fused ATPase/permease subunit